VTKTAIIILNALVLGIALYLQNVSAFVYVTDQTELKTVLMATKLNLNLYTETLLKLTFKNY